MSDGPLSHNHYVTLRGNDLDYIIETAVTLYLVISLVVYHTATFAIHTLYLLKAAFIQNSIVFNLHLFLTQVSGTWEAFIDHILE